MKTAYLEAPLLAQVGVEVGQRLVEQKRLRSPMSARASATRFC